MYMYKPTMFSRLKEHILSSTAHMHLSCVLGSIATTFNTLILNDWSKEWIGHVTEDVLSYRSHQSPSEETTGWEKGIEQKVESRLPPAAAWPCDLSQNVTGAEQSTSDEMIEMSESHSVSRRWATSSITWTKMEGNTLSGVKREIHDPLSLAITT